MPISERLTLAIPNGELKQDVIQFMQNIGLQVDIPHQRSYLLPVGNMPLDLVVIRASDIPKIVHDDRSLVKVGITGSDLVWEAGLEKESGERLPVDVLNPAAKRWSLCVGVSLAFMAKIRAEQGRKATVADLSQTMVATEYPTITRQYFAERSVNGVEIYPVGGTNEAIQHVFPDCYSILGVLSSGETSRVNGIEVIDIFHQGTIHMIEAREKLSSRDLEIIADLREKIAVAVNRIN
jgi:ATP phosphoribosyltransferase